MNYYELDKNETIKRFLDENNIDVEQIRKLPEAKTLTGKEINPIAFDYGIWKKNEEGIISITDVIGAYNFMYSNHANIIDSMRSYFGDHSNTYASRADGMLSYSNNDIIEKLSNSFKIEPICISEYEPDKYTISSNGMHRYHLLRIHYLNEVTKPGITEEEKERLKQKYSIPVRVAKLDYIKTYCNFILNFVNQDYYVSTELDDNYMLTGNAVLTELNKETRVLNDTQLIEYVKNKLKEMNELYIPYIDYMSKNIKSLDMFIETYLPELREGRINKEGRNI